MPASTCGHCPQVLCFTIVWDTPGKEKIAKWSSAPASTLEGFNEIYVVYGPKKPFKTVENAKVAKSTRVCPLQVSTLIEAQRALRDILMPRGKN